MKNLLPPNIRLLTPYISTVIIIIILGLVVYSVGFSQIAVQNQKIKQGKEEKNALTEKESVLTRVQTNLLPAADLSSIVIPPTNSALTTLSQAKILASEKGLVLTNLNVTSGRDDGTKKLKTSLMSFSVEGTSSSIIDFLLNLKTMAPFMYVDSLNLSNEELSSKASVSVNSYWAPLPVTIPGVSEGIPALTEDDMSALQLFTTLRLPVFTSFSPQEPNDRGDPFN